MRYFVFLLLTFQSASAYVNADDTFAAIMRDAKHVGIAVNKQLSSFDVYLYTPTQYADNVAQQKQYSLDYEEFKRQVRNLDKERIEARSRQASSAERAAIERKSEELQRPYESFASKIKLYTVDHAGADFIRLSPLGSTRVFVLIPFAKVSRVIISNDPVNESKRSDISESSVVPDSPK